jgi:hypothetical protein
LIFLFLLVLCLVPEAEAKPMRVVHLTEKDLEPVFVEIGFSTLLKFDSHPEPGLIGDQDAFKVEYLKNLVSIKPLVSKAQTNLFLFTKDGEFNFQLVAGRGRHDNIIYVQTASQGTTEKQHTRPAILVDELFTRKLNMVAKKTGVRLVVESIATPTSRTTLVLHILVESRLDAGMPKLEPKMIELTQGSRKVIIGDIFLESKSEKKGMLETRGLVLIRTQEFKAHGEPLALHLLLPSGKPLFLSFSADFSRR